VVARAETASPARDCSRDRGRSAHRTIGAVAVRLKTALRIERGAANADAFAASLLSFRHQRRGRSGATSHRRESKYRDDREGSLLHFRILRAMNVPPSYASLMRRSSAEKTLWMSFD